MLYAGSFGLPNIALWFVSLGYRAQRGFMWLILSQIIARGNWAPLIGFDLVPLGSLFENLWGIGSQKEHFSLT